jgi:hypothetical protein
MNQRAASDCRPPDEARRIAVEYRQAAGVAEKRLAAVKDIIRPREPRRVVRF